MKTKEISSRLRWTKSMHQLKNYPLWGSFIYVKSRNASSNFPLIAINQVRKVFWILIVFWNSSFSGDPQTVREKLI